MPPPTADTAFGCRRARVAALSPEAATWLFRTFSCLVAAVAVAV